MGCDIHLYVEVKRDPDGDWELGSGTEPNPWYGKWDDERELRIKDWYRGRNYTLFSILADVRNGRPDMSGWSAWLRDSTKDEAYDDRIEPIDMPRGLPSDMSPEVRVESVGWEGDGHSYSWFTARELLEVPWEERLLTHRGWVNPDDYYRFKRFNTPPETWSLSVGGGSVKHVSNEQMDKLIEDGTVKTKWTGGDPNAPYFGRGYYTMLEWTVTWASCLHDFKDTMLRLVRLALEEADGDLDRVRIVFWFDN